jgi:hypothetical protein
MVLQPTIVVHPGFITENCGINKKRHKQKRDLISNEGLL